MTRKIRTPRTVAVLASGAMVAAGLAALATPSANADDVHGTPGLPVTNAHLSAKAVGGEAGPGLPAGVPKKGRYAFLLKLSQRSTAAAYHSSLTKGKAAAASAARSQLGAVTAAQDHVIAALPATSQVLYRTHAVLAAVSVVTDVKNFQALTQVPGVSAVYPIAPKTPSNSSAAPLQGAPQAWQAHSNLGANSTVAIIDTGVDYTHANFGGPGTVGNYNVAKAALGEAPGLFPGVKVVGGYDLAGDAYDGSNTPAPDPWPLDCDGHGSHVAGTVAGFGENADGTTYVGSYDTSTPFDTMRIGPGIAPEAKLLAYRVFGCAGSTNLVGDAIDMAADPNGDGDSSDHADVVNMSLGSDYGSPEDGDSVMTEAASALGMTMVVASGNAGDLYDVGGSPGNAPSALTVAASRDEYSQLDAVTVGAPGSIAGDHAAGRSLAYNWTTQPDLAGDVVRVSDPTNPDGCDPLSPADSAAVAGKIAFVEWKDDDSERRCGSVARGQNLVDAGAHGFIYADDQDYLSAGITGREEIPGVLLAKTGADAIRSELMAGHTVTISGTTANTFHQTVHGIDDTIAGFSSRGIGDPGNVKPDVTAVGGTVFSTGSGTGQEGANESGTSMATPMVAGAAALVKTAHPDWSSKQVKADIMNTAGQDVFTGANHTGLPYAPQRVGSGRIQVDRSLDNDVLAYVTDDGGAVSASFGPQAVTEPTTLTKTIKVQNTGLATRSYDVSFADRSTTPGATYSVSPSTITLDPRSSVNVTLTLTLDPSAMTKTHDPTIAVTQAGPLPRQFQADASGLVELTATSSGPDLRVPAYAAPRPASAMTQPDSVMLPAGPVQQALLPLSGQAVDQGTGDTAIRSAVAGFELQARSGLAPDCSDTVTSGCVHFPDERSADLKLVGATSDAPQLTANGDDPLVDGAAYFAINTQGRWRTPSTSQEFDVYIDGNGDGVADAVLFNTSLGSTDVMVTELKDLHTGKVVDVQALNASLGDTDTAVFDSDTLVLPVAIAAIPGVSGTHSRISYVVESWSGYGSDPVDQVGAIDNHGNLSDARSIDVLHPGVALYGSLSSMASALLFPDSPASVLNLRRDAAAYAQDGGLGAMVVHFHNALGQKAQVLKLKDTATVGLSLAPNPASRGGQVTATVSVPDSAGVKATGPVVLKQGATTLASGTVTGGTAQLSFALNTAGTFPVHAEYAGDDTHVAGMSATVNLQVARTAPSLGLTLSRTKIRQGQWISGTIQITTVAGIPASGDVTIRRPNGRILASGTLSNGTAQLAWKNRSSHSFNVRAVYRGDGNYLAGTSGLVHVTVKRR